MHKLTQIIIKATQMAKSIILISIIIFSVFLNHVDTCASTPVLNQEEQFIDAEVNEYFCIFKKITKNVKTYSRKLWLKLGLLHLQQPQLKDCVHGLGKKIRLFSIKSKTIILELCTFQAWRWLLLFLKKPNSINQM